MSKNTPAPVPAGKKPEADTVIEDQGQDESGKTSAPQSSQGLDNKPKTTKPATNGKKHDEDHETTHGEPVAAAPAGKAGKQPANTTRDKSAKPAKDNTGDDDAAQET